MQSQSRATADFTPEGLRPVERLAYSPQLASQASGLPLRTITAAIASGELRSSKKGRRRLIFREDLERYLRGEKGFTQE